MHQWQSGRGGGRGRCKGRGRGRGNNGWQKKMFTKLVKDKDAAFHSRDVQPFLEGMRLFDSKAEVVSLLADDRNCGLKRIRDCLSFLNYHEDVNSILVPLLENIINPETGRPLYKVPRDKVVRAIFFIPGLVEFLASTWVACIHQSNQVIIESIAEFLLVATMSSIEARSSSHVKTIAGEIRKSSNASGSQIIRRLCAIIHLDTVKSNQSRKTTADKAPKIVCWGSDLDPPGGRHDNDHENFRDIALVPTQNELAYEGKPFLPLASGDNVVIADAQECLLDRNFRLLREDAVGTMRENMANPRASKVWSNARIIGASCNDAFNPKRTSCLHFLVQFDLPQQRKVNWSVGRALPRDGLVVLKRDGLAPIMATVFIRNDKEKNSWLNSPGGPIVGLVFHHSEDINTALNDVGANSSISEEYDKKIELINNAEPNKHVTEQLLLLKGSFVSYTMTETSDSFFSYRPVLEALKDKTSVPLAQDIVSLRPTLDRPSYLPQYVRMPDDFGRLVCNLDEWSNDQVVESTSLDLSQAAALKLALTSRVSLIQGPPGTGKTFIGGLVAQMIRDNSDESILCVCYTNHALDQFLSHMLKRGEQRLVRIGGRTKSENLKRYELKELSRTKERTTSDATYRMKVVTAQMHRANEEMNECLDALKKELRWEDLDELFYTLDGNLHVNFALPTADSFQVVGKGNKQVNSEVLFKMWKNGDACPLWLEELLFNEDDYQNVWLLNLEERLGLMKVWKQEYIQDSLDALQDFALRYQELTKEKDVIARELDCKILQEARIIGATTTGAAKYRDLLSIKSCGVVIVEEAGEVLEPHILSALSESTTNSNETKHLILIGDHKQLRPKVESYRLTKVSNHGYDFDVSLFERMILSGYPSAMLQVQHRMRPCISALIRKQTYPTLEDHNSVLKYPDVKGVTSNLLFINHAYPEEGADEPDATTKSNKAEASLCVEIVKFLLLQGYKHHQITILTPYVGQILVVLRELRKLGELQAYISELDRIDLLDEEEDIDEAEMNDRDETKSIRCASIDNFQGEESDIVVVSLVRSNKRGAIGFMKEEQRVNVLLSRAKHGMFIIGNAATLKASEKGRHVWNPLLEILGGENRITQGLPTVCQLHPNDMVLCKEAGDFKRYRPNGGCTRACGARLECGHTCPLTCHPTDTNHVLTHKQCVKPCKRIPSECPFNHPCQNLCNEKCGPCMAEVGDTQLLCGHLVVAPSCHSVRNDDAIAKLSSTCKERVRYTFSCGHTCQTTCGNARSKQPVCEASCGEVLECGHSCQNRCGSCEKEHSCKQKCERTLFCGHTCGRSCHGSSKCKECRHQCVVTCVHSRCRKGCKEVCSPCVEECDWQCEHQGSCSMVCGAPCDRLPCGKRCTKLLDCGHQCPGVCGEDCPTSLNCAVCCPEEKKVRQVDMILFTEYKDLNLDEDPIIFLPCGHFFSMSTLDGWMELNEGYEQDAEGVYTDVKQISNIVANGSKPKSCPDCRSVIHSVKRYGRLISLHCLRASEMKHMMRIKMKLCFLSEKSMREGLNREQLIKLLERFDVLEDEIKEGPMLKVFQACGGAGVDVPPPPSSTFLQFLRMKAALKGRLVESFGDAAYNTSLDIYAESIHLAEESQSRKQKAKLILDKTRLVLRWSEYSDESKRKLLDDITWIKTDLKGIDDAIVREAEKLYTEVVDNFGKQQIKEVLKAMNVIEGYDYGGGWSDHWFECPNGHPYFIGECGGAMQESRCIECGAVVGGTHHRLNVTNRRAGGALAEALRE